MRDIKKHTIIYFLYLNLFDNTYVRREDELRLISQKQEFIFFFFYKGLLIRNHEY